MYFDRSARAKYMVIYDKELKFFITTKSINKICVRLITGLLFVNVNEWNTSKKNIKVTATLEIALM